MILLFVIYHIVPPLTASIAWVSILVAPHTFSIYATVNFDNKLHVGPSSSVCSEPSMSMCKIALVMSVTITWFMSVNTIPSNYSAVLTNLCICSITLFCIGNAVHAYIFILFSRFRKQCLPCSFLVVHRAISTDVHVSCELSPFSCTCM